MLFTVARKRIFNPRGGQALLLIRPIRLFASWAVVLNKAKVYLQLAAGCGRPLGALFRLKPNKEPSENGGISSQHYFFN